jgi:hypothetical protein
MVQELFGNIADSIHGVTVRLSNADFLTLALVGGGVALVGYFFFKN